MLFRVEQEVREGLERLMAATDLLELGRFHVDLQYWDDAADHFTKALELRSDHAPTWEERGQLYARLGLWELAWEDLSQAFERHPSNYTQRWLSQALLCCTVGDKRGYQRVRKQMRNRFQRPFYLASVMDVVRVWCLIPHEEADDRPEWLVELAEIGRKAAPRDQRTLYIAGLAHYRAGRYHEAIKCCQDSLVSRPAHVAE